MRAKAYNYDLRQKVRQAIELDGMKKSEASERFSISRSTISMITGNRNGQLITPFTVEGSCIELCSAKDVRSIFEIWLEACLIPVLRPGEWVILDNATFHHWGTHCSTHPSQRGSSHLFASGFARPESD